jgi:hydroxymethylpyrimidine pyrophosphatase-like HAD family hydrolase/fructoselysine-6-P-deglycase FrlB-like protein
MTAVFSSKIDRLYETIEAACMSDVGSLAEALERSAEYPVAAVGSGGSAVSAEFFSNCRSWMLHAPTAVATPMGFSLDPNLPHWGVWLFSASGNNPDVRAAHDVATKEHARRIDLVTTRWRSAVTDAAVQGSRLHVVPVAEEKDGFLATHSLASTITSLLLASEEIVGGSTNARIDRILHDARTMLSKQQREQQTQSFSAFGYSERDTLLILHDPALTAAAVMIETSCWEAGLCSVQRTDFRNFAHGRHVWLARHPGRTFLLSMTCDRSRAFWNSLEGDVPAETARAHFDFGVAGRAGLFAAILSSFGIVEGIGLAVRVDPGKPGVADFGRRIFERDDLLTAVTDEDAATRRKRRSELKSDRPDRSVVAWPLRRDEFVERLGKAEFGGVVLDYDGTVVPTDRRLDPPQAEVLSSIRKLLDANISVALATGRGGSVGEMLREHLDRETWPRIKIGYYNGAHIVPLSVDLRDHPPATDPLVSKAYENVCSTEGLFVNDWQPKNSPFQITIALDKLASRAEGLRKLREIIAVNPGLRMFKSGHSLDICPIWAGKRRVVDEVRKSMAGNDLDILSIGDSGDWQGNDYDLLGGDFGLSVDRVCDRDFFCWNLLPSGISGPEGLLTILSAMRETGVGRARLDVSALRGV